MAQYRQQSGLHDLTSCSAVGGDHVSVGIRAPSYKQPRHSRRLKRRISIGTIISLFCLVLALSALAYVIFASGYSSSSSDINTRETEDDFLGDDFLNNVTRILPKVKFGDGSLTHGRDSRYWDGDDRRRDEDYNEDEYNSRADSDIESGEDHLSNSGKSSTKKPKNHVSEGTGRHGLYNEAGRNELKMYEEKSEASLKNFAKPGAEIEDGNHVSEDSDVDMDNEEFDVDDEYDEGIDSNDAPVADYNENKHEIATKLSKSHAGHGRNLGEDHDSPVDFDSFDDSSSQIRRHTENVEEIGKQLSAVDAQLSTSSGKQSKRHKKHRKFTSCELKLLNSTAQLVEPIESRKFVSFSLSYTEREEKPDDVGNWEPRFSGHQSLREREDSFLTRDQKINCGFVKSPAEYSSTGFDLAEDDSRYISKCRIAVVSCIFGNSDRLRSPFVKVISHLSRKNVCFVMFMDEKTLQTTTFEGHTPDNMGFIGLWKVVVVKNLPYTDMRRVGKIPKLLSHRLFPSARFSIWLDSKLRLQRDPLLLLEHFLWQKGHEYAISNHYDRHCVWEEVVRNKKLNKYNHTMIDQQFQFYQADGLKRFNASDPGKLLPSNVPEGSLIIRAHTPMSNLFSCLWFNEADRFTPRDQLSFAYTYQKLRKKNPSKTFYLHMFRDCERRQIVKLFRHRSEEKHRTPQDATE